MRVLNNDGIVKKTHDGKALHAQLSLLYGRGCHLWHERWLLSLLLLLGWQLGVCFGLQMATSKVACLSQNLLQHRNIWQAFDQAIKLSHDSGAGRTNFARADSEPHWDGQADRIADLLTHLLGACCHARQHGNDHLRKRSLLLHAHCKTMGTCTADQSAHKEPGCAACTANMADAHNGRVANGKDLHMREREQRTAGTAV